jgi:ABC-type lipoprotein export system ATPase subunit
VGAEPIVRLRHVRKGFTQEGPGRDVLQDLSLEVGQGEMLGIYGPSGSGKTTILNLVGGLDTADEGTVWACGVDLTTARRRTVTAYRARSVGFVFQFYNLLPTLTALENVEAGLRVAGFDRADARERGRSVLERVGLAAAERQFPAALSGGEQQRVAIARALAKRPALVLADEPTGNLDEAAAEQVATLMHELNQETGTTFVVVTHDPAVARAGSRVMRLTQGRLTAGGPA